MNKALLQQALDASEKMRSGLIQMQKEAESYGEAWAAAYVNEYRDLLPGSAEEQFKLLNAMQRRLSDYADAVTEGYDAIQALRTELARPDLTHDLHPDNYPLGMRAAYTHAAIADARERQHRYTNEHYTQCKGTNCTATAANQKHSDECIKEHDAAVNGKHHE